MDIHIDLTDEEAEYIDPVADTISETLKQIIQHSVDGSRSQEELLAKLNSLVQEEQTCKVVQGNKKL